MGQSFSIKTMYVVKVIDPDMKEYGQYYGGFNKRVGVNGAPYYVKKCSKAKMYSNPKDIFLRPFECVFPVKIIVHDTEIEEGEALVSQTLSHQIVTPEGAILNSFTTQGRRAAIN